MSTLANKAIKEIAQTPDGIVSRMSPKGQAAVLVADIKDKLNDGFRFFTKSGVRLMNVKEIIEAAGNDGGVAFELPGGEIQKFSGLHDAQGRPIMLTNPKPADQIEWEKSDDQRTLDRLVADERKRSQEREMRARILEMTPEEARKYGAQEILLDPNDDIEKIVTG